MADGKLTYDELKARLNELEAIADALRGGQVDAVVGKEGIALLRLAETERKFRELNATLEQEVAARTALAERRARDLRRLAAELSQAEHRERKRLAGLLHDDLQQLLIAIRLRLPVVADADAAEQRRHIATIDALLVECITASRNLTQELSPPVLHTGTVADVIDWLAERFREQHRLEVIVETQNAFPDIPEHLQVFLFGAIRELLLNVVKHSGKMKAKIALLLRDGNLAVRVEDWGERFDPEAVEAKLQRPEGFGLFNIRERLEALGGKLTMETVSHGGACFELLIPLGEDISPLPHDAEPSVSETEADGIAEHRGAGRHVRLLLVDDHAVVREGLVGLLQSQPDFEVVGEGTNGAEAVQKTDQLQPDAVILDIDMPILDGIEATRRIRERHPDIVIIGLSFHDDEVLARKMVEAGADIYISKYMPSKEFVAAVRDACLSRRK